MKQNLMKHKQQLTASGVTLGLFQNVFFLMFLNLSPLKKFCGFFFFLMQSCIYAYAVAANTDSSVRSYNLLASQHRFFLKKIRLYLARCNCLEKLSH